MAPFMPPVWSFIHSIGTLSTYYVLGSVAFIVRRGFYARKRRSYSWAFRPHSLSPRVYSEVYISKSNHTENDLVLYRKTMILGLWQQHLLSWKQLFHDSLTPVRKKQPAKKRGIPASGRDSIENTDVSVISLGKRKGTKVTQEKHRKRAGVPF